MLVVRCWAFNWQFANVRYAPTPDVHWTSVFKPVRTSETVHADVPLRFQCTSFNGRQTLSNGREEALYFFPQVSDRLAIARKMPQQASLEESIKQRIEGAPGDGRLSAAK